MRLAASNIGWTVEEDAQALAFLAGYGFTGLEVAPGRVVPEEPYEHLAEASAFSRRVRQEYGLAVVSLQSIWFGHAENLFKSVEERRALLALTKKAVDFAAAMECPNLVFGCPRGRSMPAPGLEGVAEAFFLEVGDYAAARGAVLALEANPPIYNTNFINRTEEAFAWVARLKSHGIRVNLDLGTMVENGEDMGVLKDIGLISHAHVSEPYLAPIERRDLHGEVREALIKGGYQGFISLEMRSGDFEAWQRSAAYVAEVFA